MRVFSVSFWDPHIGLVLGLFPDSVDPGIHMSATRASISITEEPVVFLLGQNNVAYIATDTVAQRPQQVSELVSAKRYYAKCQPEWQP